MTATFVVPVVAVAEAGAAAASVCAMALAPSPATTRQATENERENARFMWFKNSSVLSQIARACGSEPRFLIYLLRCSLRRIPAGKKAERQDETRSEDILRT